TLVLKLIDRFPLVVTLGAGLLGWIAGGMLITDIYVVERWGEPAPMLKLAVEAAGALVVVAAGKWLAARRRHARPTHDESASTTPGG
ncbi:TerC family protein, partial [Bordetella pertussis]|nr:TerC family protein [Bordetella pertussis]